MKKILFVLICFIIRLIATAQVDIDVKELAISRSPDGELARTVKITVINYSPVSKILFLLNDYNITGYNTQGCMFRHPFNLLGELGGGMIYNDTLSPLILFANWFKIIEPNEKFTMYFQRNADIDIDGILRLMRCRDYRQKLPYSEELNWKDEEIIIHLPIIDKID